MQQEVLTISPQQARTIALGAQGLLQQAAFGKGKAGTLRAIEQLGYVQIDTINVVERAHHHTLWTRQSTYRPEYLGVLLEQDRSIFEFWSHAAAYLPMRDYRYALPRMAAIAGGEKRWYTVDKKLLQRVLDRIRSEGPLAARDFEAPRGQKGGTWWNHKPAKQALEQLFMSGKLMVSARRNFQKVYDLTERVLPRHVCTTMPDKNELLRYNIRTALRAHGFMNRDELRYLRWRGEKEFDTQLAYMLESGELSTLQIRGLEGLYYSLSATPVTAGKRNVRPSVKILGPFDNAIIQRKRARRLYALDYTLECYVPEARRIHGYFVLPLLYGRRFIGRMDAKADRKSKLLTIKSLYFEDNKHEEERILPELAGAIREFARFNACTAIQVVRTEPQSILAPLQRYL